MELALEKELIKEENESLLWVNNVSYTSMSFDVRSCTASRIMLAFNEAQIGVDDRDLSCFDNNVSNITLVLS